MRSHHLSRLVTLVTFVAALTLCAFTTDTAAEAVAHDAYFGAENDTQTIGVTFAGAAGPVAPPAGAGSLKFLYKHWGDGAPEPAAFTDKLAGAGAKPPWPGWNGTQTESRIHTTTHAKGSESRSSWETIFTSRVISPAAAALLAIVAAQKGVPAPPPGTYPGINGELTARADARNFTKGAEAHTRTDWSDPFRFFVPANTPALLFAVHGFSNDGTSMTFADATPDGPNESGQASVARRFHGQISDAGGTLGSPILLQEAMVGTASGLINVTMGNDVTFLDGQTELEKEAELSNFLAADAMQWLLPFGESVDLSFAWSLGSASFDRTVALDLTGALRADEQQVVPEPSTLTLLCLAVALLGGLRFHAGRIRATATA